MRSVQGDLEQAALEVFGTYIPIYLAGRTDRGVHAAGQVATFADPRPDMSPDRIFAALNDHLARDIAVLDCDRQPMGFHARYSAKWREYRYRVWSGARQPLVDGVIWTVRSTLDAELMQMAAQRLVGDHDFASLAGGGEGVPGSKARTTSRGTVRIVRECDVRRIASWWGARDEDGDFFEIRVVANGFLPRMVRGIVGLLVEIGRQNVEIDEVDRLLDVKDRREGPVNAPAEGLTLWSVDYEDRIQD